jgi:hypothetical protein
MSPMTEQPTNDERTARKTVVVEHSTTETSRSILPALIIVGIIVVALLIFIFMRLS